MGKLFAHRIDNGTLLIGPPLSRQGRIVKDCSLLLHLFSFNMVQGSQPKFFLLTAVLIASGVLRDVL